MDTLSDMYSDIKDHFVWLSEKKESKIQMKEDLDRLKSKFFDLSQEDQDGLIDIIDFILDDGSLIEIKQDDKQKEADLIKCANIIRALPRKELVNLYNMFTHKIQHKKSLREVLSFSKPKN